jgi:hypothetical protein
MDPRRKIAVGPGSIPQNGALKIPLAKAARAKNASNPFMDFQEQTKDVRPVEGLDEFVAGSLERLRFETYANRKRWGASEEERAEANTLQLYHSSTVRGTTSLDPLRKDAYGAELMDVMHQMSVDQKINPKRRQAGLRLPRFGEHAEQAKKLKWVIRPDLQPRKNDNNVVEAAEAVDIDQMVREAMAPETLVEKFVLFLLVPVVPIVRVDMLTLLQNCSAQWTPENAGKSDIAKAVEDMIKRTMKRMDNNGNGVLSGAEWDAGLQSTGWQEYYDELYGPDVTNAEFKRVSKTIFLDLCKGKGLLNTEQFLMHTRQVMLTIGRRGELARIKGIALKQKLSGVVRIDDDVDQRLRKTFARRVSDQGGILQEHEFKDPMMKGSKQQPTQLVGGTMTLPTRESKATKTSEVSEPVETSDANGPGSKSSSPRKEGPLAFVRGPNRMIDTIE